MKFLIIVADSLRYDSALQHEGLLGVRDWDAIVPCGAHAPYTPSSLTTIATGLHPVQHRYWTFPPHSDPQPARSRYVFSSDIPAPVAWFSSHRPSTYAWPDSSALNSVDELTRFMNESSSAVAFVHLWESHIPYEYEHDLDRCLSDMAALSSLEDRIRYTHHGLDAAVEVIRPVLDAVTDDTIILLTGDHGEALGEPNPFPDGRRNRWIHEHTLKEEMLVPMFVDGLDLTASFVRHSQIVPTIRSKFGLKPAADLLGTHLDDISLVGPVSHSMASCRWAIPEQGWEEHGMLVYDAREDQFLTAAIHSGSVDVVSYSPDSGDFIVRFGQDPFTMINEYLKSQDYHALNTESLEETHRDMEEDEAVKDKLRSLGYLS